MDPEPAGTSFCRRNRDLRAAATTEPHCGWASKAMHMTFLGTDGTSRSDSLATLSHWACRPRSQFRVYGRVELEFDAAFLEPASRLGLKSPRGAWCVRAPMS